MGIIAMIVMFGTYYYYKKSGKPRPLGLMTSLILVLYFGMRFFVEYFKEYQVEENIGGLREGQILSIPFLAIGLICLGLSLFGPWRKQNVLQFTGKYQINAENNIVSALSADNSKIEASSESIDNSSNAEAEKVEAQETTGNSDENKETAEKSE